MSSEQNSPTSTSAVSIKSTRAPVYKMAVYARRFIERMAWAVATLFLLGTFIFVLVRSLPGDPALTILGDFATEENVRRTRETLGLDSPTHVQYAEFLRSMVTGDLGVSFRSGRPVLATIGSVIAPTMALAATATLIALSFGIGTGLLAARLRGGKVDAGLLLISVMLISLPSFWIGLVLIYLFADVWPILPATGSGRAGDVGSQVRALILPTIALSSSGAAMIARVARSSVLEVQGEDYIVVAKASGLSNRLVIWQYSLRNALPAILATTTVVFAICVSNAVVIEAVFSRRGLGSMVLDATLSRDYPLIQGGLLAMAAIVLISHVVSDLMYPLVEPRSRA